MKGNGTMEFNINTHIKRMTQEVDNAVLGEIKEIAKENGIERQIILNERNIIFALKKQIPKKPIKYIVPAERIKIRNSYWCKGTTIYKCPHCNNYISITNIYCHECGQAIDWSDTE